MMDIPQKIELLKQKAVDVYVNAYAPYSQFPVGCAMLTNADEIYTGCNVENSSYGLTLCAERNAITTAVAAEGAGMKIRAIAVAVQQDVTAYPCGACRQFIHEFSDNAVLYVKSCDGWLEMPFAELLPHAFSLDR